jgi:hypothetical protein
MTSGPVDEVPQEGFEGQVAGDNLVLATNAIPIVADFADEVEEAGRRLQRSRDEAGHSQT